MGKATDRIRQMTRRIYPRAPLEVKVHYRTTGAFLINYSTNLSRGGVFIETDNPVAEGEHVTLRLEVPGAPEPFETTAVVVWSRTVRSDTGEPAGMGLRFDHVEESWAEIVDHLVSKFTGVVIGIIASSSTRRTQIARLVHGVLSCRIVEVETADVASGGVGEPVDLALIDVEPGPTAAGVVAALHKAGTPVVALAATGMTRAVARGHGAADALESSPSVADLRAAVLRALGRPFQNP